MKTVAALARQSGKTLLVWFLIMLIIGLITREPGSTFKSTDMLRAVVAVALALLVYRYSLWWFQPSKFLAGSLRFDTDLTLRGSLFGAALALPLLLLQLAGWFNLQFPRPEIVDLPETILRALTLALVAGVTEELMFRGILLHALENVLGTWWAWLLQASVFGLVHYLRPDVLVADLVPLVFMGLLFGAAYILTRNLWYTIAMHTVYDWMILSYPGAIESMLRPGVDYEWQEYFILVIFCVVMLKLALPMLQRARVCGHILPPAGKPALSQAADPVENEAV
ncbi:MAG: CPBP family intramembrane glutamic endopeptidase [Burkholderiales bacterium]